MTSLQHIAVIGAGAWGTALANACARAGRNVTLIARDAETAAAMKAKHESPRLPGVAIDDSIAIGASINGMKADVLLIAVPTQAMRDVLAPLQGHIAENAIVISCAKGIERGTLRYTTEIISESLPRANVGILSGPSFADDVARGLPTAVTLATHDETLAAELCQALGSATFRPYHSTDVRGVEIGGAAKNVLAIAAGIVAGKKLGASALAAVTTRGFAELARFGRAFGARPETLAGLSGLGDLVLTCSSTQSRNFSFGIALGQGASPKDMNRNLLVEGAFTAIALLELAEAQQIEMPICKAVTAILENRIAIDDAIAGLLSRPFRSEE